MAGFTRRSFIQTTVAAGIGAACAPAAAPAGTPGAAGSTGAAWEGEWNQLIAAAKKEGKLALVTYPGPGYREAIAVFEAAFPGITVEQTPLNASNFVPRWQQERKAGVYEYDAMTSTWAITPRTMAEEGGIVPIRQVITRPDLLDDKVWLGGFDKGFLDKDEKWVYASFIERREDLWINTDMVADGEIKTVDDLLNPKWKGKILTGDPRAHGGGFSPGTQLRLARGEEFLKRLWKDQECAYSRDNRQLTEFMVRGRYAIGAGAVYRDILIEFTAQGLGKNLKRVDVDDIDSAGGGRNIVWMFDKAPDPNAAKLFINWLLTKEGQTVWSKHGQTNSRRLDVEPAMPDLMPVPGKNYRNSDSWDMVPEFAKTQEIARAIVGS